MAATVLVLSTNVTLGVALTLRGEWDVVTDPDRLVSLDADAPVPVVIVDDDGRRLEDQLPDWTVPERTLVLTNREHPEWAGAVLARPYRLDHLMRRIRGIIESGMQPAPAPDKVDEPPDGDAPPQGEASPPPTTTEPARADKVPPAPRTADESVESDSGMARDQLWSASPSDDQAPPPRPEPGSHLGHVSSTPGRPRVPSAMADPPPVAEPDPPPEAPPIPALPPDIPSVTAGEASVTTPRGLDEQFRQAIEDARRLSTLVDHLPALASRTSLSEVLAEEIAARLGAPTVGIWAAPQHEASHGRYRLLGGAGLTQGEAAARVTTSHPVVADALASGGTAVENIRADPARVTGLPASRHPSLVVVPLPTSPLGDLIVIVGLVQGVPDGVFREIDDAVRAFNAPMRVCVEIELLASHLRYA